jgi:hypothetical protein
MTKRNADNDAQTPMQRWVYIYVTENENNFEGDNKEINLDCE